MAQLSNQDRLEVGNGVMRNRDAPLPSITKPDLRAAIEAIDAWLDGNATSFNSAIPQPARGILSAREKAELLMWVVARRHRVTL